jgi:hypothetical protein
MECAGQTGARKLSDTDNSTRGRKEAQKKANLCFLDTLSARAL